MISKYYNILHNRSSSNSLISRDCKEGPIDNSLFFYIIKNSTILGTITIDNRIDEDSKIILNTFNKEIEQVYAPQMSTRVPSLRLSKSTTQIEFSSLVHSLAKIMEIELNNSIVQQIRKINGIEMPQYYKSFKPNVEAIVQIGKDCTIDINSRNGVSLRPQTIGAIQCLVKHYKKQLAELFENHIEEFNEFIELLESIREKRNDSSHTKIISEKEFIDFYSSFCAMVREGWFTKLMDLKQQLGGC